YRADPVLPTLSIGDASVSEGDAGTTALTFTVTLSAPYTRTVTVPYATADGSATTADDDYAASSGTLTFAPGETSRPATLQVNGDTKYEPGETLPVVHGSPSRATLADGTGVGTIGNDDPQPMISIGDASVAEGNSGTSPLVFTATLSNPSSQTITV